MGSLVAARVFLFLLVGAVAGAAGTAVADEDQVARLVRTLAGDASEKARISAAVALGRLREPRTLYPFMHALADRSPVVRGLAASALGHLGDPAAVGALESARGDPDPGVRARAQDALLQLRPPPRMPAPERVPTRVSMAPREAPRRGNLHVVVKPMAVRARAGKHLGGRMRDLVVQQLGEQPGVTVDDADGELIVDGTITRLVHEDRGPWVETTCEVKLTVSSAAGNLLSIVSGGATVQTRRGAFSKRVESTIQAEALDNAVLGVQANLVALLARHGASRHR